MRLPPYLKALVADPLFMRVCMALWGAPFLTLAILIAAEWRPEGPWEWVGFACVELVGIYGAYLIYTGFLGSRECLERSTDLLSDGGEILGAVLALVVAALAIPITILLRIVANRSQKHGE